MRVLVTGASGFIARHLIRHYVANGADVTGWSRNTQPTDCEVGEAQWRVVDMLDADAVLAAMQADRPDCVFHLSAQSLPGVSWHDPVGAFDSNVLATVNLLMALRECTTESRLILVSSSSVYASNSGDRPILEDDPAGGVSLYAVSKLAQEMTARLWGRQYDMPVVTIRPFFVIGPEKRGDVCADFAQRIVRLEREGGDIMRVGNLDAVRDFVAVEDAVRAFRLLADTGETDGVYNLARGEGWAIKDILDGYRSLSATDFRVETDPQLMRPLDEPVKIGDPSRLKDLGWAPRVSMEEALRNILAYWREIQ